MAVFRKQADNEFFEALRKVGVPRRRAFQVTVQSRKPLVMFEWGDVVSPSVRLTTGLNWGEQPEGYEYWLDKAAVIA
jgi:hypothetical protein